MEADMSDFKENIDKVLKLERQERHEFYIYNTMSGEKEVLRPKVPGKVGMYVCGITPYDYSHIGHARTVVAFDVLYRYLQYLGYEVVYVRNFTDVDDKIIHRANQLEEDVLSLSSRYSQEFQNEMSNLQCLPPTHEPRVSEHIEQIISMINQIISHGYAYAVDGDVYFSLGKFPNYGCLSGIKPEENIAGKRVAVDSRKEDHGDFALWKAAKPGEPSWDSPWGHGRPGWHIECSAMSYEYLTSQFDIHGGGRDLIFPHHENEIVQSWGARPDSKVSHWLHVGTVSKDGKKMSKSDGNYILIREAMKMSHPLALRYFILGTHYRSPFNYLESQLDVASDAIYYVYQTLQECEVATTTGREGGIQKGIDPNVKAVQLTVNARNCIDGLRCDFKTKMLDDLQTPPILNAVLPEALKFINKALNELKKKRKQPHQSLIYCLIQVEKEVRQVLDILGLLSPFPYSVVLQQFKDKALERARLSEDDVLLQIQERVLARKNKDFSKSDQIRKDLAAKGIALMDVGNETMWRPCAI